MNDNNIILFTDSYKLCHWNMYPMGTQRVYSYFESREGAKFPTTMFFGLQYLLKKYLVGSIVSKDKIEEAYDISYNIFDNKNYFNKNGWEYILYKHDGMLPLEIKSIKEGTNVDVNNVLMTVENTDDYVPWLTNDLESLLSHVWYPSTVATLSYYTKKVLGKYLKQTSDNHSSDNHSAINFQLHDFGYRGVSSHESAETGGAAHLLNFYGTDTVPSIKFLRQYYNANPQMLGLSVPATEHSIMTAFGENGEGKIIENLLQKYPTGILSVVVDSYNIYDFITNLVCYKFKEQILTRDGVFVVRPDSVTKRHPSPESITQWILEQLNKSFGSTINSKGYKVLNPKVRVIYGDGLNLDIITNILRSTKQRGFSSENLIFGMGGGLLQKINRDTQRFAFKCSAQKIDNLWHSVFKDPLDSSKKSKKGKLILTKEKDFKYKTIEISPENYNIENKNDLLDTVFLNGELKKEYSLEDIRKI